MKNDFVPRTSITAYVELARASGQLDMTILRNAYLINYERWITLMSNYEIREGFLAACNNFKEEQIMDDFMYEMQQEMLKEQAQRILYTTETGTPYAMDKPLIIVERGRKGTYMWGTEYQVLNQNGRYLLPEQKGNKDDLLKGIDTMIADEYDIVQRYDGDTPDTQVVGDNIAEMFTKSSQQAIKAYAEMKAFIKGQI